MFVNSKNQASLWSLKIGLAAVFLWFGVDKFFHPNYWIDAWVPANVLLFVNNFGINEIQFTYLNGIFEVVVGLSLLTGVFSRMFAFLATLFLCTVILFIGFNEVIVRDVGLIGGLMAIALWPARRT